GLRTKDGERAVLKAPLPRCSSVPFALALCVTRLGCCSVLLDLKISMRPDDFRGARTLARRVETRLDACRSLRGRQASTRVSRRQARVFLRHLTHFSSSRIRSPAWETLPAPRVKMASPSLAAAATAAIPASMDST